MSTSYSGIISAPVVGSILASIDYQSIPLPQDSVDYVNALSVNQVFQPLLNGLATLGAYCDNGIPRIRALTSTSALKAESTGNAWVYDVRDVQGDLYYFLPTVDLDSGITYDTPGILYLSNDGGGGWIKLGSKNFSPYPVQGGSTLYTGAPNDQPIGPAHHVNGFLQTPVKKQLIWKGASHLNITSQWVVGTGIPSFVLSPGIASAQGPIVGRGMSIEIDVSIRIDGAINNVSAGVSMNVYWAATSGGPLVIADQDAQVVGNLPERWLRSHSIVEPSSTSQTFDHVTIVVYDQTATPAYSSVSHVDANVVISVYADNVGQ